MLYRFRPDRLVLILLVILSPGATWVEAASPKGRGREHPPLVLRAVQGEEPISIDAYRGKKVLLLHFAPWLPESYEAVKQWRERTEQLVTDEKLVLLGVMHDQHRDRCALFARWKGIDFPILHDPMNLSNVSRLPTVVGLDEHGVVRVVDPDPDQLVKGFVRKKYKAPKHLRTPLTDLPDPRHTQRIAGESRSAEGLREHGDALLLRGNPPQIDEAIRIYQQVLQMNPKDWLGHFHLGVAFRTRYDGPGRQPGDFQAAIDAWYAALRLKKKNDVLGGRLQQFGLRHEKPAAMYGWVETARREITASGEMPVELAVEPSPIERAKPRKKFKRAKGDAPEGDPDGKIARDDGKLIELETVVVPSMKKKAYAQVLLIFRPNPDRAVTWSDAADPLRVWIERPKAVKLGRKFVEFSNPPSATSDEERMLNVEIKCGKKTDKESATLRGYALYRVTQSAGEPKLLRRDFEVKLTRD